MKKLLAIALTIVSVAIGFNTEAAPGLTAPSNLVATAVSSTQINLAWQDNSGNETGFKIERSLNGTDFSEIAQAGANVVSYPDANLSRATTYYYRIRAYKVSGGKTTYSGYSNTANATTLAEAPAVTTSPASNVQSNQAQLNGYLTDMGGDSFTNVKFEWGLTTSYGTSTSVEVKYATGVFLAIVGNLSPNTIYHFRAVAQNSAGTVYGGDQQFTTLQVVPNAPSNLAAYGFSASSTPYAYLNWQDNSGNETGFSVERSASTNPVTFAEINTVGTNQNFYYDFSVFSGVTYYYRVRAFNGVGYSDYSNTGEAIIP